jgi:radical SAM/Cys-rich protein
MGLNSSMALSTFPDLNRDRLRTLQVNLTYRCNQRCGHCHVNAGPNRSESMDSATVALIPRVLQARGLMTLDLTGGAPELHPGFRDLVQEVRRLGVEVIDRCNLTILSEPGQEDLAAFLADQGVRVVASLPCYLPSNVDRQRGDGVFARSIAGLQALNRLGYGQPGSSLILDLVFNPSGPVLPPPQAALEADYRQVLERDHGVVFHHLLVLTNMPIQRFAASLRASGAYEPYLEQLRQQHDAGNLSRVMCRSLISVDWMGRLHDCDFNQQLGLGLEPAQHLADLLVGDLEGAPIRVGDHCFGCTAGAGSSCGGALR